MARIDKLFVSNWENYKELRDWLVSKGSQVKDDFGNIFNPIDYLAEYTEEEFNSEVQNFIKEYKRRCESGEYDCQKLNKPEDHVEIYIMNNPVYFDVWLIRYCPVEWLQDFLKRQYDYLYDQIKTRTSLYDTYNRNGLGKNIKVNLPKSCKNIYGIRVEFPKDHEFSTYYDSENDRWNNRLELKHCEISSSIAVFYDGPKGRLFKGNRRSVYKCLQKWNLPENSKIIIAFKGGKKVKTLIRKL